MVIKKISSPFFRRACFFILRPVANVLLAYETGWKWQS